MPTVSFIDAYDAWSLWGVILCGVALAIYLEQNFRWATRLSGPVIGLLLAMALSNVPCDRLGRWLGMDVSFERILPTAAPAYDVVTDYLVPVAVSLLLFRANLAAIWRSAGSMLLAFHLAALGTLLGTALAVVVCQGRLADLPGSAGMMAASYTGGGVNFVAVQQTYQVAPEVANALLVADNFVMAGMFLVLLGVAEMAFFRRRYRQSHALAAATVSAATAAADHWRPKPIGLADLALTLALATLLVAVADKIAGTFIASGGGADESLGGAVLQSLGASKYVWITLLTVAAATLFPRQVGGLAGAEELGAYLLYVFLFVIGLPASLWQVLATAPLMFGFCLIIAVTNLVVTLLLGRLLRLNLEELLLAVNATLGGAPSVAAMAVSKNWSPLVLPAVLAAVWGYVIGTSLGILVVEVARRVGV